MAVQGIARTGDITRYDAFLTAHTELELLFRDAAKLPKNQNIREALRDIHEALRSVDDILAAEQTGRAANSGDLATVTQILVHTVSPALERLGNALPGKENELGEAQNVIRALNAMRISLRLPGAAALQQACNQMDALKEPYDVAFNTSFALANAQVRWPELKKARDKSENKSKYIQPFIKASSIALYSDENGEEVETQETRAYLRFLSMMEQMSVIKNARDSYKRSQYNSTMPKLDALDTFLSSGKAGNIRLFDGKIDETTYASETLKELDLYLGTVVTSLDANTEEEKELVNAEPSAMSEDVFSASLIISSANPSKRAHQNDGAVAK